VLAESGQSGRKMVTATEVRSAKTFPGQRTFGVL
jgi:hypothetical protein